MASSAASRMSAGSRLWFGWVRCSLLLAAPWLVEVLLSANSTLAFDVADYRLCVNLWRCTSCRQWGSAYGRAAVTTETQTVCVEVMLFASVASSCAETMLSAEHAPAAGIAGMLLALILEMSVPATGPQGENDGCCRLLHRIWRSWWQCNEPLQWVATKGRS